MTILYSTPSLPVLVATAALAGLLALAAAAWLARALGRRRLVDDLPTLPAAGVFIGMVEVHGTAESERPFNGHLSGLPVVFHEWNVAEHWVRTRVVTSTDSKGRTTTRVESYSGTDTVAQGGESAPFWLQDESGLVQVDPEQATVHVETTFAETVGLDDPLYHGKAPPASVSGSIGRRTFREQALPLHHEVYVIGQSRLREDAVAPEIAAGGEVGLFRIATGGEEQVRGRLGWSVFGIGLLVFLLGGVSGVALGMAFMGQDAQHRSSAPLTIPIVAGALSGLFWLGASWAWAIRNGLIDLRERVRQARSLVEVELQRRADLIPRLVAVVEASAGHEREVQTELAAMRAQAAATVEGEAGTDPRALAPRLQIVGERYPELKAAQAFSDLHRRLVGTEDRIARARSYVNAIGASYDDRLEQVPDTFMAKLLGLRSFPLLAVEGFERRPVDVDLGDN
ncbi:LemA family protein [Engelhardtia mirabilis]|uniref:LemA family protein n=1 Tax=Engelhardtia mirabilis TaxID=2528011 RepID=UPI003AF409C9